MTAAISDVTAIILAAGVGSRLRPLTDDRPKCLVSLGAETILLRAVRMLSQAGIRRVIVSAGYLEERIREAMRDTAMEVTIVSNPDYATTQNVVSLARALDVLRPNERFVKLDGDVVFDASLIHALASRPASGIVAVDRSGTLGAEEMKVLVDDPSGPSPRVRRFGKALDPIASFGESIGIEWFNADAAPVVATAIRNAVMSGRTDVYYEDIYNDVLDRVALIAEPVSPDAWFEIDDLADLERARLLFGSR